MQISRQVVISVARNGINISSVDFNYITQIANTTMRNIYNYMLLSVLTLATVGCIEDEFNPNEPSEAKGSEVKFGLSLEDPDTKTIYGPETDTGFPVYWSEGDKVLVASPQCAVTSAEYEVTPVSGQNYAEALNKTGAAGVQWGSTDAYFYSVYPSTNASWTSLSESNVTAKLNIASEQSANIVLDETTYSAADMDNVIMYANTAKITNGDNVDLNYKPYSTILEFEMSIGAYDNNESYGSAKVISLTLTAPENTAIAGDFSLKFNGIGEDEEAKVPTISPVGNNSNVITMAFTTQPMLTKDNSLKAKIAVIPDENVTSIADWKLTVEVLEGNNTSTTTFTKTLNTTATLKAGMIHKIKLPKLKPSAVWDYNLNSWMTALYDYKNIYLTELSIPGAWYSLGKDDGGYQASGHTAATLWNAGVRAFAVETRTRSGSSAAQHNPDNVVVSGTADNNILSKNGGKNSLHVDTNGNMIEGSSGNVQYGGTQISTVISAIASQVANTEEFAVLILSYADGGSSGHRYVDHGAWLQLLYDAYNSLGTDVKNVIYQDQIDENTTIGDVIGKLIIKVNVDENIAESGSVDWQTIGLFQWIDHSQSYAYADNLPALFSYNRFAQQIGDFSNPYFSSLYWMTWSDSYRTDTKVKPTSGFNWCFSSANRTQDDAGTDTTIPKFSQRKAALASMIEYSKEITEDKGHNIWFYFNAGGTKAEDSTTDTDATDAQNFAKEMNPWLLDVIKLKANGGTDENGYLGTAGSYIESDPSPLGIIMFNQCTGDNTTYYGADIIKEIIEMNNKFKLLRYDPNLSPAQYGATATVGGDAF